MMIGKIQAVYMTYPAQTRLLGDFAALSPKGRTIDWKIRRSPFTVLIT